MLGDLIYEHRGKITNQRVRDVKGPKVEATLYAAGRFIRDAIDVNEILTYWNIAKENGVLYGEGKGVIMSRDGEIATHIAKGIGRFTDRSGGVSFRGSVFLQTPSLGKLAFINNIVGLFEYEADGSGNTTAKIWEWK